jgi:hypothetical protein
MGVGIHAGQRFFHGVAHPHLVDVAHVEHLQPLLAHKALFAFVHAADADLPYRRRAHGRRGAAYAGEFGRAVPTQHGHRHAVHIAGGREGVGVEVGVRVQPQHAQFFAGGAAVARHRADGAYAQAVVAAQQDGQASGRQALVHGFVHRLVPVDHFRQVPVAVGRRQPGVGRAGQVAGVGHVQAARLQRLADAGHAQGLGAHGSAAAARAYVGGSAYQVNGDAHQRAISGVVSRRGGLTVRAAAGASKPNRSLGLSRRGTRSIWRRLAASASCSLCR